MVKTNESSKNNMKNKVKIGNSFVDVAKTAPLVSRHERLVQNPLLSALIKEDNYTTTENGATTLKSTLNSVLDFYSTGAALRNRSNEQIVNLFVKAFNENPLLSLKALFNIRNVRGGAGERKTFRIISKFLGDNYPEIVKKNLANIVLFGRFDDLFSLFDTKSEQFVLEFIKGQIDFDVENYYKDNSVSLLAKWMPSNNTSSYNTRKLAHKISRYLKWSPKQYRKTLSELRRYIQVVESKMSANEWDSINFESVPSKASLLYRKAFYKRQPVRYGKFIADVKSGKKKINAATLFPYEIVEKVNGYGVDETVDVLWDNLPNYMGDNSRNILTVCDVSGSMAGRPMSTSIALGIYTAERNTGPFAGYFITYSAAPTLQKVVGNNIREKVKCLSKTLGTNTNLQAVFDSLLQVAIENNISQKDMPEQILIVSDVEFDHPQNHGGKWNDTGKRETNLDIIKKKYINAGYELPCLVYWNVRSAQNNVPARANEKGVLLVSGSSPSVFKTLLSGKQHTPVDQMLETLNNPQYNCVTI